MEKCTRREDTTIQNTFLKYHEAAAGDTERA